MGSEMCIRDSLICFICNLENASSIAEREERNSLSRSPESSSVIIKTLIAYFLSQEGVKNTKTSLRSRRLEVVGTRKNGRARTLRVSLARARSLSRSLLPSACYAGYTKTERTIK